ncbi:hypothetical protein [Catenibacillus scindens]|uniref:hypothetical protein n=1 Tax=Catenibacillus scindens TaxID=673271 RepID=UPI003207F5F6
MLNICVLELIKDEHGFFKASQTISTACLRSYLKQRGINSMIYTDDTLPSLHDLAEDVLSVSDDALALICNPDNEVLVNALAVRIASLEDIPMYLIGARGNLNCMESETVVCIPQEQPEIRLAELLQTDENPTRTLMECSPYAEQILLPQDAQKYGVWFGRERKDGQKEYREIQAIYNDIHIIQNAFNGLSQENKKVIPCAGTFITDRSYLEKVLSCFPEEDTPLCFVCPVDGNLLDCLPDTGTTVWKISLSNGWDYDKYSQSMLELLDRNKIASVRIETELLEKDGALWTRLADASRQQQIELELVGKWPQTGVNNQDVLLRSSAWRYVPFSRGFLKSRTGVYTGVALDGYVKHIEVTSPLDRESLLCLNEVASINSSIYMNGMPECPVTDGNRAFDQNGVAVIENSEYDTYRAQHLSVNAIESNLLRSQDGNLRINNLAYTSSQKIFELPYRQAKAKLPEMEKNFGLPEACFYIFTLDCAEDFACFLQDAETFQKRHTFYGLPLAYGYLKNYCRFLNSSSCSVDKMPRIQLTGDGNVYVCSNFAQPIGKISQAIFELTQSCYVKKETIIKQRDCAHCTARSWCAKCTQLPVFMEPEYCDIIKNRTHVIDYIMSSLVYIDMTSSIPSLKKAKPQDVQVTSESMFPLTGTEETGNELPYFPKFSYLFTHQKDTYVLWSAASGKFFHISSQFALFAEMLFKRLPVAQIINHMHTLLDISVEESRTLCETITKTLNQSGALYRVIKD